jgi:hypothetical protein
MDVFFKTLFLREYGNLVVDPNGSFPIQCHIRKIVYDKTDDTYGVISCDQDGTTIKWFSCKNGKIIGQK